MGPWPQSHGYAQGFLLCTLCTSASMGPWPQSHGYFFLTLIPWTGEIASMGPWPQSHGYEHESRLSRLEGRQLQWGHGRKAMDTRPCLFAQHRGCVSFNGAMAAKPWIRLYGQPDDIRRGKLQWGHGRKAMDTAAITPVWATRRRLQWGHGRKAMDTSPSRRAPAVTEVLQWGHGRKAMDTGCQCAF